MKSKKSRLQLKSADALKFTRSDLREFALQVGNARSQGWSWQEIADHLGVSKQAVHKKYARHRGLRGARP